ncbi:MAG: 30S ribosome-binding factor RbfA [Gemmataceae bacterium]
MSEVVREVAASTILFDMKDPRVKGVTVTRAEVSADLQHAKIYVSVMGTAAEQKLTMHGLKSAAGFVQTKVAERLTTRYVPHVTFVLDEGVKKSIEISKLIREEREQIEADAAARAGQPAGEPADAEEASDTDDESQARPESE